MTELSFVWEIITGLARILAHPLFYVALLLVFVQYRMQNNIERRLFGVRCTTLSEQFFRSFLFGIFGGLFATLLMTLVGVVLSPVDLTYVWVLALVLSAFNVRYICFAYAGGLLSLVSLILQTLPTWQWSWGGAPDWIYHTYTDLRSLHVSELMALVAILHLVEALLVRWNGDHQPMPVFVEGKRGRLVGGFLLQKFWVLPMAAFVVTGVDGGIHAPSWWPLLSAGTAVTGLTVVPFPAMLGYSGAALTMTPKRKTSTNFKYLLSYSVILLGLAIGSSYFGALGWLAAVFCTVAHELLILFELREEQSGQPIYVRPMQGLKILAVLPDSPAAAMGLLSGETIVRVNGTPVNTPYDLHFALNQNPAFAKLELLTPEGELRFAQRPIYTGDHHALGVVLVPDEQARQYVRLGTSSPWRSLWAVLTGGREKAPSTYH